MDFYNYQGSMSRLFKATLPGWLLILVVIFLAQIPVSHYFPVKTVKIYGVNRVSKSEMHDVLFPFVSEGFFSINVDAIRKRLLEIPWIADLHVRRIWPDQVEVMVWEKNPVANWNSDSLLDDRGELFTPKSETFPLVLPKFIGPSGAQGVMLHHYKTINKLLSPLHVHISYLELTPFLNWKLKLDNGIFMQVGRNDVLTRLDHFVKVYPKIVGARAADVDYIDLRYPNGVAVRWKERINT